MTEMHSYRAYFLSVNDHIRYVTAFKATDDASARTEADLMLGRSQYSTVEVYLGWRLVGRAERKEQAA